MIRTMSKPHPMASFRRALALSMTLTLLTACSKSNNSAAKGGEKFAKLPAGVAAKVAGNEIPTTDLDQMMQVMMQQGFQPDSTTPGATPDEQRKNFALDRLIERRIVLDAAKVAGIGPTPSELDQRVAQVKATYGIGDSLPNGMTEEMLRRNLSDDMTISQYFNKTVIDSIPVSQADIQAYYDQNPTMFAGDNRIHASHILFLVPQGATPEQKTLVQKKAQVVLADAKKGQDFAELARKYSEDPQSAPGGGDLSWFTRGQMMPEFEAAAFALEAGQISDVVEVSYGYHIIKVIEKGKPLTVEEVKPDLERMLRSQKAQVAVKEHIDKLKAGVDVIKAQPTG
ncbi:MAG: peptidyl-prolyl cis-trans isomerase C [bacterium]|nr:MAG: peptidyl-prolyl cis-trans isomerase C [bacterium]